MKKIIAILLCSITVLSLLTGCGNTTGENGKVYVYNWGEYIDPDVIKLFEQETGIKVEYEEFETNEIMFPKISAGVAN